VASSVAAYSSLSLASGEKLAIQLAKGISSTGMTLMWVNLHRPAQPALHAATGSFLASIKTDALKEKVAGPISRNVSESCEPARFQTSEIRK
jgi:hypothetical protein